MLVLKYPIASSQLHFAYLIASQVNQVEYLSVSNCSHTTSGTYPIRLESGNQRVDNTNSSLNNANAYSGICLYSPSLLTSFYCTISNNKASGANCIYLDSSSGMITIYYANIVYNNSPSGCGVVFVSGAGLKKMMYCIFHNNEDHLFSVWSGTLEVSHSFIYHSDSFSTSTYVSTDTNNTLIIRNTYQIQYFHSLHCNADFPYQQKTLEISPMMTLDETISRTNGKTSRITNERTLNQITLNETPYRSYIECFFTHQIAYRKEIIVIFSILFLSFFK